MTPNVANRASSAPLRMTHFQAGLRLDRRGELRPVRSATHGLGRHRVNSADAHRLGDGAKSPHGLDGATKVVGRDGAGLGKPFGESGKRLFVEAGHRRAAELVIDQEPDRVRADVDDRIGAVVRSARTFGVEVERPQRLFRRMTASLRHRLLSAFEFITGERPRPADGSSSSSAQMATGAPVRTERSAAWQSFSDKRLPRAEFNGSRLSSIAHKSSPMAPAKPSLNQEPVRRGRATPASV